MSIHLYSYSTHSLGDLIFFCAFKYHFYADDSQVYHVSQISLLDTTPISNYQLAISIWILMFQQLEAR